MTIKKTIAVFAFCICSNVLLAQQDTVWRRGGLLSLNFSQVSLTNWAAGGQNSIAANSIVNYYANYKRGKNVWDNNLDLAYGFLMQGKEGDILKSDDKIDLSSKYGREAFKNWYYSLLFNFRSQFTPGYNYPNDSIIISDFLSPGYILIAPGLDYKPKDYFSLLISPATARFLIVNNKDLSDAGAFGVDSGKTLKTELGAYIKATFKKDIATNVNLQTSIDFYSNYLDNPQNIDINWQLLLSLKVNKYISASISTQLIYDDDTKLVFYKSDDVTVDHVGPGIQFKEVLGIGIAYKFSGVSVK